jgi:hypothetical protein
MPSAVVNKVRSRSLVEVLTSFCARLYGRRSAKNRVEKALRCAAHDVGPQALARVSGASTF